MKERRAIELIQRALRQGAAPHQQLAAWRDLRDNLTRADILEQDRMEFVGTRGIGTEMEQVVMPVRRQQLLLEWADGSRLTLEVRE